MTMSDENAKDNVRSMPALKAAIDLWETLAAFAWEQMLAHGRGVVLAREDDLRQAQQRKADGSEFELSLGYVSMQQVPAGDDFLKIIAEYDLRKQIVLLVERSGASGGEDDEQLFVLEAGEQGKPSPEECFYAMTRQQ